MPGANTAGTGSRRKKLLAKREHYQELYAGDLITMAELKQKLAGITRELNTLDTFLAELDRSPKPGCAGENAEAYRREIRRFLELETVTSMDMRRILDHISLNREKKSPFSGKVGIFAVLMMV